MGASSWTGGQVQYPRRPGQGRERGGERGGAERRRRRHVPQPLSRRLRAWKQREEGATIALGRRMSRSRRR